MQKSKLSCYLSLMKKILLPALFSLLMLSCSDSANNTNADSAKTDSVNTQKDTVVNADSFMPKDSVPMTDTSSKTSGNTSDNSSGDHSNARSSNGQLINGNVFFSYSYCGGAKPTEEILKQYQKLQPLYTSEIHLTTREKSITITTDKSGVFTANIPDGTYDIYLVKVPARIFDISSKNCATCTTKAIGKVTFPNKMKQISFTFPCGDSDNKRP